MGEFWRLDVEVNLQRLGDQAVFHLIVKLVIISSDPIRLYIVGPELGETPTPPGKLGDKTGLLDPGTSAIRLVKPNKEMEKDDNRIGNEISYAASPDLKHHLPGRLALVILSTTGEGGGLVLLACLLLKKKSAWKCSSNVQIKPSKSSG